MFRFLFWMIIFGLVVSCSPKKRVQRSTEQVRVVHDTNHLRTPGIHEVFKNDLIYTLEGGGESFIARNIIRC